MQQLRPLLKRLYKVCHQIDGQEPIDLSLPFIIPTEQVCIISNAIKIHDVPTGI